MNLTEQEKLDVVRIDFDETESPKALPSSYICEEEEDDDDENSWSLWDDDDWDDDDDDD